LEFACNKAQSQKLSCDNECQQLKDKARAEEEAQKRQQKLEAERLQREEAERFEAKMEGNRQKRNNRRNRRNVSENQDSTGFKYKIPLLVFFSAFLTTMLAVYFYY